MRTLTFALIAFGIAHLLSAFIHTGGGRLALDAIQFASFVPFSISLGCAVTANKPLLIVLLVVLLLGLYPCDVQHLATGIAPVGIGILVGTGIRASLRQEAPGAS